MESILGSIYEYGDFYMILSKGKNIVQYEIYDGLFFNEHLVLSKWNEVLMMYNSVILPLSTFVEYICLWEYAMFMLG